MKANEAPEKLYFGESDKGILDIYSNRESNDEVEYTRTDAFIEKACEWMKKNGCGYWLDDSALPNRDLIEDFRKYMEE